MFDPTYSEEQLSIVETARKFTAERIIPVAAHHDETSTLPLDVLEAAWELGLVNAELPETYDGLGLSDLTGCLLAEELAYGCAGMTTAIMANQLAARRPARLPTPRCTGCRPTKPSKFPPICARGCPGG